MAETLLIPPLVRPVANDRRRLLAAGAAGAAACLPWRHAGAQAQDAAGVAQQVFDRPGGRDMTTLSRMELSEKGHAPRTRSIVTYRRQEPGGERTTLIRFLEPGDIAGVGLLSTTRSNGSTEQSLYLPELDRVRRISSERKGGRFVGSDLSFEDLQDRNPARDTHRVVGRESIAAVNCTVIESTPVDEGDSIYGKRISWIDTATWLPLRVDYHVAGDATPTKRWTVAVQRRIQNYWTVIDSTMLDLRQGSQTRLVIQSAIYDRKLPARLFSTRALGDESYESEYRP